jgi:hypothetical protein
MASGIRAKSSSARCLAFGSRPAALRNAFVSWLAVAQFNVWNEASAVA